MEMYSFLFFPLLVASYVCLSLRDECVCCSPFLRSRCSFPLALIGVFEDKPLDEVWGLSKSTARKKSEQTTASTLRTMCLCGTSEGNLFRYLLAFASMFITQTRLLLYTTPHVTWPYAHGKDDLFFFFFFFLFPHELGVSLRSVFLCALYCELIVISPEDFARLYERLA